MNDFGIRTYYKSATRGHELTVPNKGTYDEESLEKAKCASFK